MSQNNQTPGDKDWSATIDDFERIFSDVADDGTTYQQQPSMQRAYATQEENVPVSSTISLFILNRLLVVPTGLFTLVQ